MTKFSSIFSLIAVVFFSTILQADDKVEITPDVVYGHKFGMALTFDVFKPAQPNGLGVLFMVSGGWYSRWSPPGRMATLLAPLLDAGFVAFAVRHGSSPRYKVPDAAADVRLALDHVAAGLRAPAVTASQGLEDDRARPVGRAHAERHAAEFRVKTALAEAWQGEYGLQTAVAMGLHLGQTVFGYTGPEGDPRLVAFGDTVNIAERLAHRARAGEIVFSEKPSTILEASGFELAANSLPALELARRPEIAIYGVLLDSRLDFT